jgi:hypothetical protein
MSPHTEIRSLTLQEAAKLVEWAGPEGWNPSPADAPAFFAADRQGFIGCFVDGELASGISAIAYGETFGFIGLYITRPDFRGKGYGLKVWNAAISRLAGAGPSASMASRLNRRITRRWAFGVTTAAHAGAAPSKVAR